MPRKYLLTVGVFVVLISAVIIFLLLQNTQKPLLSPIVPELTSSLSPEPTQSIQLKVLPQTVFIENNYHIYQSFNNCGPAALSMALSYFGINESQKTLGDFLRPYQNPKGDNDDKSVTLEELAKKAEEYGLLAYHRPAGSMEIVKHLLSYDLPVITRTLLHVGEDIGHYRVIKGYDEVEGVVIQDDSLQGKNLRYSYDDFNELWKTYSFEYLVLVPADKKEIVEAILEADVDPRNAWGRAEIDARQTLVSTPEDMYAGLNLSVALYHLGRYQESVTEFEKVENRLPFRTLWYQIEPIHAYYELGDYDRVFTITNSIFEKYNRAFSELYIIRGKIYENEGDVQAAQAEYEKAVLYNRNLVEAHENI